MIIHYVERVEHGARFAALFQVEGRSDRFLYDVFCAVENLAEAKADSV
jgi:hypothetical protein